MSGFAAVRLPSRPLSRIKVAADSEYPETLAATHEVSDEALLSQICVGDCEALAAYRRQSLSPTRVTYLRPGLSLPVWAALLSTFARSSFATAFRNR